MSSVTGQYARAHAAFTAVAQMHGLRPMDVRILVALHDLGGTALSDELERATRIRGSMIRRSSLELRREGFIVASGPEGDEPVKRGTRARFTLSDSGRLLSGSALALIGDLELAVAA